MDENNQRQLGKLFEKYDIFLLLDWASNDEIRTDKALEVLAQFYREGRFENVEGIDGLRYWLGDDIAMNVRKKM